LYLSAGMWCYILVIHRVSKRSIFSIYLEMLPCPILFLTTELTGSRFVFRNPWCHVTAPTSVRTSRSPTARWRSRWLTQFACDRATIKDQGPSSPLLQFPQLPMEAFTPEPPPYTKPSTTRNKSRNAVGGAGDPGVHSESGTGKEAPRADATGRTFITPPALRVVVDFCSYPN